MNKNENENPFEIDDSVNLDELKLRQKIDHKVIENLRQSLLKLPIDKTKSIQVPKSIINTYDNCRRLVDKLQKEIREEFPSYKEATFAIRVFKDAEKKYVYSRIWRIN